MATLTATATSSHAGLSPERVAGWVLGTVLSYILIFEPLLFGQSAHAELTSTINQDAAASNPLNQLFWVACFGMAAWTGLQRRSRLGAYLVLLWPLLFYLAWSTAGILWALNSGIVVRRLFLQVMIIGSLLVPVAVIDEPAVLRRLVFWIFLATIAVNFVAVLTTPPTPLGHAGIYSQKNVLGMIIALGMIVCLSTLAEPRRRRAEGRWPWLGIAMGAVVLVASVSKTSIGLAILVPLACTVVIALSRAMALRPSLVLLTAIANVVAVYIFLAGFAGLTTDKLLEIVFGDTTFTGRTDIWAFAWERFLTRPILGHGFNGFWGAGDVSLAALNGSGFVVMVLQAHNGYLDILIETGIVGLCALAALVVVSFSRYRVTFRADPWVRSFTLNVMLLFLLHNLFESSAFRRYSILWVMFLVAVFMVTQAYIHARRPAQAAVPDQRPVQGQPWAQTGAVRRKEA
ncbi:MAG TPA: O-antigen ligase family protein [Azospirillaceae bacterium]|nr:O-antigen ligase family protein [Azospirillaceae bacterium]